MLEALRKVLGSKNKKIRKFYLQAPKNLLFSKKQNKANNSNKNPAKTKTKQQWQNCTETWNFNILW